MRNIRGISLLLAGCLLCCQSVDKQDLGKFSGLTYPVSPHPFSEVEVTGGMWGERLLTNREITIPFAFQKCEESGRIDNFSIAGRKKNGTFQGKRYDDSDVFKVIEGAAYSFQTKPDPMLDEYLDSLIQLIGAAQEDDGYLFTTRTIQPDQPADASPGRWSDLVHDHELYNVGHLYEAAVAHHQATGKRDLLAIATQNADLVYREFVQNGRPGVPGHQEIEIGLVRLFTVTGNSNYLELAQLFLDRRGQQLPEEIPEAYHRKPAYSQQHLPVAEQTEAVGHAVRAGYQYTAMADVAALTQDSSYLLALEEIWQDVVEGKQSVTGGVGASRRGEAFGEAYDLPNAMAYNETCAAVANMMWNYRMFLLHGEAKYLDVFERVLYNGFLAGVSLEGDRFFYVNPLEADGEFAFNASQTRTRAPWFSTSCCPVNVARFLPSLPGYIYASRDREVLVNLFIPSRTNLKLGKQSVAIEQATQYPWEGRILLTVSPEKADSFKVSLRLPAWTDNQAFPSDLYRFQSITNRKLSLRVNGELIYPELKDGFASISRRWQAGDEVELIMPLPIRKVVAHEAVAETKGKVALSRGPIVFCVEGIDVEDGLKSFVIPRFGPLETEYDANQLKGIQVIKGRTTDGRSFQAIPYYAWSHRGEGSMKVWLPVE